MTTPTFSDRLKHSRAKAGMSQADLAGRLGVNPVAVSRWERGVVAPRLGMAYQLANALGCSIAWLLNGQEEEAHG